MLKRGPSAIAGCLRAYQTIGASCFRKFAGAIILCAILRLDHRWLKTRLSDTGCVLIGLLAVFCEGPGDPLPFCLLTKSSKIIILVMSLWATLVALSHKSSIF